MADKIAVEPAGACANSAFHSSATGQDNYVGFGAEFHPNMPLVSEVADAYDVSAYDGITFRAKTGGGPASQPVFVEILTKETQPATSGGTVHHYADRQKVDLYNNRGFMATITSTSYQQFFVPFGALIPRSMPAQSNGRVPGDAARCLCQAPKFVPHERSGIQFSWYGPMDTPGFLTPNPVGSYNVFIDDVAFYKRSALTPGRTARAAEQRRRAPTDGQPDHQQPLHEADGRERQAARARLRQLEEAFRRAGSGAKRSSAPRTATTRSPRGSPTA